VRGLALASRTRAIVGPLRLTAALCTATLFGLAGGCRRHMPTIVDTKLLVRVNADDGGSLEGVAVSSERAVLGHTNGSGSLRVIVRGREGDSLRIGVACPAEYHDAAEELVKLRGVRHLQHTGGGDLELQFECRARERRAALVVKARGQSDLPVMVHGREVARTDARGIAHATLTLPRNSSFLVRIDTSAKPGLKPKSPETTFSMDDQDAIFLLEQAFEQPPRPPPRRRAAPLEQPAPKRRMPIRI
jgi:hypothetical protein